MDERRHVGRPVTTWQVDEILNAAYRKAVSVQNLVTGFKKEGLWPLTIIYIPRQRLRCCYDN